MTEEELKAIEQIKRKILIGRCEKAIGIPVYISDLDKLLNLIENQQKEIESLRNYISYAPNLDEMTATKYNAIQKEGYIRGIAEAQERAKQIINEECIPKQKIKDKIEELEKKQFNEYKKHGYSDNYYHIVSEISVLQELLEERN